MNANSFSINHIRKAEHFDNLDSRNSSCFGWFRGRLFSALNNVAPDGIKKAVASFAEFLGLTEKVKVQPCLPKKIEPYSFSYLSRDVTHLIAAKLPLTDLKNFRLVEKCTNRSATYQILKEKIASLESFTSFLLTHFHETCSAKDIEQLTLTPEFRQAVLASALTPYNKTLHSMKFVLVAFLMKHFTLDEMNEFYSFCYDNNITVPKLHGNAAMYFANKTVIHTAADFTDLYFAPNKRHTKYNDSLAYWINQGFVESSDAYFFELDLVIRELESELRENNFRSGLSDVFKNMFLRADEFQDHTLLFVQKIETIAQMIGGISDAQLQNRYLENIFDCAYYYKPHDTILNAFSNGFGRSIKIVEREPVDSMKMQVMQVTYCYRTDEVS